MASGDVPFPKLATGAISPQISSVLGIHPHQGSTPINESLIKFHCFPRLPLELRRKIWNAYLDQQPGRIIELEWDTSNPSHKHDGYKVTNLSSRTPSVLRDLICRDARDEALQKYQLWCFDNRPEGRTPPSRLTYFDPSIDTIYFGIKTCLGTMCRFVESLVRTGKQLSRVAIYCPPDKRHTCMWESKIACSYLTGRDLEFDDTLVHQHSTKEMLLAFGLNSLYGVQVDEHPDLHNGWPNLEEIILIVSFFPPVDESITFRPAKSYIGKGYERMHSQYFQSIQDLQSGQPQFAKWAPGNQPKVHFACLSKRAEPGKVFDLLMMTYEGSCPDLDQKEYVNNMISLSNPHCQVSLLRQEGTHFCYFELYGTEEGVFSTKKACLTILGSFEERYFGKTWRQKTDDQWKEWNFQFGKSFLY